METVYALWYVREWEQGEDTELLIGIYKTEADVDSAIARLRDKPGFIRYPEGFQIEPYVLGEDHWKEGFARMAGDVDIPADQA